MSSILHMKKLRHRQATSVVQSSQLENGSGASFHLRQPYIHFPSSAAKVLQEL